MYRITKPDGSAVTAESINFIRRHSNGSFVFCNRENAEGVAHDSTPYLFEDGTSYCEVDSGKVLDEMAAMLAETDEAAIELFESNLIQEAVNAEQDEAIIEIYEAMEGIING